MDREEFVEYAALLGDRQAEAFFRRHVDGESRGEAADAMGTSKSNVDNLERAARSTIRAASNLTGLVEGLDAGPRQLGTCAQCDEPATRLRPDPLSDAPLRERPMLCPDCHEAV
jgi:hypothetical protein